MTALERLSPYSALLLFLKVNYDRFGKDFNARRHYQRFMTDSQIAYDPLMALNEHLMQSALNPLNLVTLAIPAYEGVHVISCKTYGLM